MILRAALVVLVWLAATAASADDQLPATVLATGAADTQGRPSRRVRVATSEDRRGAGLGGYVSALNIDSDTALSITGSFEYRFTRVIGLEIDATLAPRLKSPFPGYTILAGSPDVFATASTTAALNGSASVTIYPGPTYTNPGGRAVILSNNVRITIPTTAARVEPYFVAGGGIASVRHTADFVYNPVILTPNPAAAVLPPPRPITRPVTSSALDLALTLGGGVGVRTIDQLWIEVDLRLLRLLGDTDANVGRFGVGARYRF